MAAKKPAVVKKKIKAYPLEGELVHGASKVVLDVMRVSPKGIIAQVKSGICHVGVKYTVNLILNVSRVQVTSEGQVSRTYDGVHPKTRAISRMMELLFVKIPDTEVQKIRNFLAAIGQKE